MASVRAVTFDFHNTLVACDRWFQIEVHSLVSAYLQWLADQTGRPFPASLLTAADQGYRRLRRAIHVHGHELPAERCIQVVFSRLGIDHDEATVARGVHEIMRAPFPGAAPMPGAVETVRALRDDGVPLGIVSSAVYHPFLEWCLDRFFPPSAFAHVATSASAGFYKSRPEIYWRALAAMGADRRQSIHIGDSLRFDVGGAKDAGMHAVLVSPRAIDREPGQARPDLHLATLNGASSPLLSFRQRVVAASLQDAW